MSTTPTLTPDIVGRLYRAKTGENIKHYHFAVIALNDAEWFDPAQPAGRLRIIGFFNDSGEIVPPSDELIAMAHRVMRECGEFADHLGRPGELDYISIGIPKSLR